MTAYHQKQNKIKFIQYKKPKTGSLYFTISIIVISIIFILTPVKTSFAYELHTFIDNDSQFITGLILEIENDTLTILDTDSNLKKLNKPDIQHILTYKILENPIQNLRIDENLALYLKDVYISDYNKPSFTALPIQMIGNIVIFFGITGKIHVYELSKIVKLRPFEYRKNKTISLNNYNSLHFNIGDVPVINKKLKDKAGGIYPTKILSDKIKIYEFLSKYQEGFFKIHNFQERTFFYAKPFLFDQRLKAGNFFVIQENEFLDFKKSFNPYIQWSSGTSYGFQNKTAIGGMYSEWTPELLPFRSIQSEIKSHFFNTIFIGNFNYISLPVGSEYYTQQKTLNNLFTNSEGPYDIVKNNLKVDYDPYITTQLNYLLLLGCDYGPFSLSTGIYYPIYAVRIEDHFREILASNTSPYLKTLFIRGNVRIKLILSYTKYHEKRGNLFDKVKAIYLKKPGEKTVYDEYMDYYHTEQEDDIYGYSEYYSEYGENREDSPVKSYKFDSYFTRIGISYNFFQDTSVSIDEVIIYGKYNEVFQAEDQPGNNFYDYDPYSGAGEEELKVYEKYNNRITFTQFNTGLKFQQNFSDYASINTFFNYYIRIYDYDFFKSKHKVTSKNFNYGFSLEFIF